MATVHKADAEIARYTVPAHYWYARWRHASSARPVVRTPQTLSARGWLPHFGREGVFGGRAANEAIAWPGPMGIPPRPAPRFPFNPAMAAGGDHEEIGFLTESAATYAIFGDEGALTTARTEAEWCGNWCMHIRDDATGAMPDFRDALRTQYVCDAVLKSAQDGRWEPVAKA